MGSRPKRRAALLVVEDDRGMRALITRAAEHLALHVVATGSLAEAREVDLEGIDAMVVDYFVSDGTGAELVREIREALGPHGPPALLVTATPESVSDEERALFVGVLTKPFRLSDLYDHLEEMRGQSRRRARSGVVSREGSTRGGHSRDGTDD